MALYLSRAAWYSAPAGWFEYWLPPLEDLLGGVVGRGEFVGATASTRPNQVQTRIDFELKRISIDQRQ